MLKLKRNFQTIDLDTSFLIKKRKIFPFAFFLLFAVFFHLFLLMAFPIIPFQEPSFCFSPNVLVKADDYIEKISFSQTTPLLSTPLEEMELLSFEPSSFFSFKTEKERIIPELSSFSLSMEEEMGPLLLTVLEKQKPITFQTKEFQIEGKNQLANKTIKFLKEIKQVEFQSPSDQVKLTYEVRVDKDTNRFFWMRPLSFDISESLQEKIEAFLQNAIVENCDEELKAEIEITILKDDFS